MITYRTHTCGELNKSHKDKEVILSGWIHKKRDHGNLLFIDLRDHYGITQCVIENTNVNFKILEILYLINYRLDSSCHSYFASYFACLYPSSSSSFCSFAYAA